ncbi:MAG: hypothetical protein J5790_09735 [Bacteroidaceae bacterium]|nr:hypothetical protein [Bacteroidaceae bacterium]
MKHYIFILAMMLNAVALHAQEMSIPQLMEYLEKHHPEGMFGYTIIESSYTYSIESVRWTLSYDKKTDKPIDKYHLELLKDSILRCFTHASETALSTYYQQTSNGTDDTISYVVMLDSVNTNRYSDASKLPPARERLQQLGSNTYLNDNYYYHKFTYYHFSWGTEQASFTYLPGRDNCRIYVFYNHPINTDNINDETEPDFQKIQAIVEKVSDVQGTENYDVSYRYTSNDPLIKIDESAKEHSFTGHLYIVPKEQAESVANHLSRELKQYIKNSQDNHSHHTFSKLARNWYQRIMYPGYDFQVHAQKDQFGRYGILVVDHVDGTLRFPRHSDGRREFGDILTYDHGKETYVPSYRKLIDEHPEQAPGLQPSWFNRITRYLFDKDMGHFQREENIGGDTLRQIITWQWELNSDSLTSIKKRIINSPFTDILFKEVHTEEADTLELTAESVDGSNKDNLICKFYSTGDTYTAFLQLITTIDTRKISVPFNTRWVNDFIQQMKDSSCIEEYPVSYQYGKKSDSSSMGKVSGRLYVVNVDDQMSQANAFEQQRMMHEAQHPNQTFHIVDDYKDFTHHFRITDRILARISSLHGQFQLLCIDHVDGKYLIPEEWYNITNYKYGEKTYLKKKK